MSSDIQLSEAKRLLLQKMLSGDGSGDEVPRVTPRAPGTIAPISPDQSQVWLHAEMAPDAPIYNEAVTVHRSGPFDLAVMERSFNEILRRHETWRTSFDTVDGEAVQVVHSEFRVRLTLDDLTSWPRSEREHEALRMATEDARRPFDLREVPLFRARVVKLAEEEHRLYLAIHHIIFDGVSLTRVFVPELAAIYDAFSRGEASSLAEPTLQYGDYAAWRERRLSSEQVERQMAYWRRTLSGPAPRLELARARPPAPTYRGAVETFTLSAELTQALKAFSRGEGMTLYMTLLAAFKAMLFRYSGQEDLLIGGVTDLRRRPELERLMGYFLNAIVLRTAPSAGLTFRDYLTQVRVSVLGALDACEAPFDQVVREVSAGRETGAHPIFQAMFSMQPLVDPFPAGWDFTQMDVVVGGAKFDLYLELEERPEGMCGRFIYACDLFEADAIQRMIHHWRAVLHGALADPDCTLARLPLMSQVETRQVLHDWNATEAPVPAQTVQRWFRGQVERTPHAVAVEFEGRTWTYGELDSRSDAVAAQLQTAGVSADAVVGICMNRSLDMVAGVIGILKAGGAYLPLDPNFPQARLSYIIDNARPAALLTQAGLTAKLQTADLPVILCDTETVARPGAVEVGGEALAYVLYTSGSTGQPKGVEVPQSALVNLLAAMQREVAFTPGDTLLAVTTLSFDLAAFELLLPLVSGGRVIVVSRELAADPSRLAAMIGLSACTVMAATPATWRALIEGGWTGKKGLRILCGGEAMSRGLADDLLKRSDALWNVYGPTETTIFSTVQNVRPGPGPVPIGRPIANLKHYILDPSGSPAPIGVVGELYIGGAGVARGYRHRSDLTQARFVELAVAPGVRLYRTGDLASYRPDGLIDYHGRIDSEEKIRGFRVAVEEIEAALGRRPEIAAAAVKAWPDASGNKALTAYIVVGEQGEPMVAELRRYLSETLPDYMVPSRFARIEGLPMTPTGKVDRKALPEPQDGVLRAMFTPPDGPAEERLAEIWMDILGAPAVGRDENFFDLGGHSLLVARLLRRVEFEYGRRLTMAAFFHGPTVEAMTRLLSAEVGDDLPVTVAIQPNGRRPPLLWLDASSTFRKLAHVIGLEQPFLGVPVEPVLERADTTTRLEDVARQMAQIVGEAQSKGPYYLGGWCNMGVLAYEVAAQLVEGGDVVGLVVLLDAPNPVHYRRISRISRLSSAARYHWPRFWHEPASGKGRYLADRVRGLFETSDAKEVRGLEAGRAKLARMVWAYEPPVYSGDVALFQARQRLDVLDFRQGWAERVTGELVAHDIPGTHITMHHDPNVQELGALMRAALLDAQARNAAPSPIRRAGG